MSLGEIATCHGREKVSLCGSVHIQSAHTLCFWWKTGIWCGHKSCLSSRCIFWRLLVYDSIICIYKRRGQQRRRWLDGPTLWTWVWVSSKSWWSTGKTGVLQSTGSWRVRHDWVTELNWTELTCIYGTDVFWYTRHCLAVILTLYLQKSTQWVHEYIYYDSVVHFRRFILKLRKLKYSCLGLGALHWALVG